MGVVPRGGQKTACGQENQKLSGDQLSADHCLVAVGQGRRQGKEEPGEWEMSQEDRIKGICEVC